jgi:dTDP-4-dehydrorhamnose reductase
MEDVDITDGARIRDYIESIRPDCIIHTAALTDVDGCESDVEKAFKINGEGTRNIAEGAKSVGAALLYLSTDYVFDGTSDRPYREDDEPKPLGVYGQSKHRGELNVRDLVERHYIVRTGWLYGEHGSNFVETIIGLAGDRLRIEVVDDQVGSPTYTKDLAPALAELMVSDRFGTYHLTNQGSCSWFEFAGRIIELAGISGVAVVPTTTERFARPAPRPSYSVLENLAWREAFGSLLRPWGEAIEAYMRNRGVPR